MKEHVSSEQIERYRARSMGPDELLDIDEHVGSCEECRLAVVGYSETVASVNHLRSQIEIEPNEASHLTYEQLSSYVDGAMQDIDREILESHIDDCSECAREVHELQRFKQSLTAGPDQERPPVRFLAPARFSGIWRSSLLRWTVEFAAAAALALIVAWITILPLRRELESSRNELAQLRAENKRLSQEFEIAKSGEDNPKTNPDSGSPSPQPGLDTLSDGGIRLDVSSDGNISGLEAIASEYQSLVKAALAGGQVPAAKGLEGLAGRTSVLMGNSEGVPFRVLYPIGKVVLSDRPTFQWQPLEGATSYKVSVFDANYNEVATSGAQASNVWAVPNRLERGRIYSWQVTATKDAKEFKSPVPPAPQAKFKVMEGSQAGELTSYKRDHPDSHLILGLLYARAGQSDLAERELQIVAAKNPHSELAQRLLKSVKSRGK